MTALLVIIYIAFISLGLPDSLLGSAWPAAYGELGVPLSWAGILSFTVLGGTIISSFFSARIIRRFKTGLTTTVSVSMTAVSLLGISFSTSFPIMLLFCIPLGLGAGSVDAALNNFVALHYKAKHMNWLHCFWGIGATAGPMIMSFMLAYKSWHAGYAAIGWIQVALVAMLIITLPLWKKSQNNQKGPETETKILPLRELIKLQGAKPILFAFFCYCAIEATAGLWGSSFLVLSRNIDEKTAALWIALYYFGITFGRLISGFMTMHFKNKSLIRIGQACIVLGILLLLIPSVDFVLCIGFFIIGFGCAPIFPSLLHDTPENFGAAVSQSFMGIQMACAYVGATFMPLAFGMLQEYTTMSFLPFYLIILVALLIGMIERLNKIKQK